VDSPVRYLSFSPDSQYILTAEIGDAVRIYDAKSGKEASRIETTDFSSSAIFDHSEKFVLSALQSFHGLTVRRDLWRTEDLMNVV
jgi:WD40 repeat protein